MAEAGDRLAQHEAGKLLVFITYSRRDALDFADQLDSALGTCGFETIDRHGIAGGEDWERRLGDLILGADTVVFVLSPESAISKVCDWEVEEAHRLSKRILPILAMPLAEARPPAGLEKLNHVHFYGEPSVPAHGVRLGAAASRHGARLRPRLAARAHATPRPRQRLGPRQLWDGLLDPTGNLRSCSLGGQQGVN